MSNLKLLTSITFAFCTATELNGERHCPGNVPSVPLRQVQGAVNVVSVNVNGAGPFDFLLDTGGRPLQWMTSLRPNSPLAQEGKTYVSLLASVRELHEPLRNSRSEVRRPIDFIAEFDQVLPSDHALIHRVPGGLSATPIRLSGPRPESNLLPRKLPCFRPIFAPYFRHGCNPLPLLHRSSSGFSRSPARFRRWPDSARSASPEPDTSTP